ncbi:aldose 1-epimerase family protein YeaD [Vibrio variabilis]|uniref:Aldose 1-epimerase family protein YeaD n=1 Tax=Vibrio variabilis TaxID=990271 RepID=A0ABQ0J741_9VIBR|nr:aldose 1-epimerase family protein YeaD [Vibrio variabilis]
MDLSVLPTLTVLSDYVTIAQLGDNKMVRVLHPKASAAISLHGGHVVSFKPEGQEDLIWMSKDAVYDNKAALRGGIQFVGRGSVASPHPHMASLATVLGS